MTYTQRFNPTKYEPIMEYIDSLQTLEPRGKLVLTCDTVEQAGSLRQLLYDWLHHMKMKKLYMIRWEHNEITIIRKGFSKIVSTKQDAPLEQRLDELLKAMITAKDKETALSLVTASRNDQIISPEEMGVLLSRYDKIMED